jgi:hypothetical protein
MASNPIHLMLIFLSAIYFFRFGEKFKTRQRYFLKIYFFAVLATFLLFCLLLVWDPWRQRLHLPILVLYSPFVGTVISMLFTKKVINFVTFALILMSIPYLFFNESRPLILNSKAIEVGTIENIFGESRINQYFINSPASQADYLADINEIVSQECSNIGLNVGIDDWEYPFWVLAKNSTNDHIVKIKHVNVSNISVQKMRDSNMDFIPCAVIVSKSKKLHNERFILKGSQLKEPIVYIRKSPEDSSRVFFRQSIETK